MDTTSQIDETTWTVTRALRVEAPRELVFEVLTQPSQIAQWFGQSADFPDGVHVGAEGSFGFAGDGIFPVRIETYDPVARFAFAWGTPGEPIREDNSTTATFTLEEDGAATLVTVVESGFDTLGEAARRRAAMEHNAEGWQSELDEMAAHAEGLAAGTGLAPHADLDAGRITRSVLVRAPQQTTWDVLSDPSTIGEWWGHPAVFPDGMRPGASGTFEWVGHGLFPMRVTRAEAPSRLDLLWGQVGDETPGEDASLVQFTLTPVGTEQTLVTVVETGFREADVAARRAAMEENVSGWRLVLDALVRYVEAQVGNSAEAGR